MLSNFSRSSQDSFVYRQKPVGGHSTICLGDDAAPANGRFSTSADSYGRMSSESYASPSVARSKYASSAKSNIFTPDYNNPHNSAGLSRGGSAGSSGYDNTRPIFLQEQPVSTSSAISAYSAGDDSSACTTPRTYRSVDAAPPAFLSQPAPLACMKDVFSYASDDAPTHSQRIKQARRDSARQAAESMAQGYSPATSADNRRRNVRSNVFAAAPSVPMAYSNDEASSAQRPHFRSSVFSNEPLEHKVTRRYQWSDVFGTKDAAPEDTGRRSRARPAQSSQIIFG